LLAQARRALWAACLNIAIETLDLQTRPTSGHVEEPCVIPTGASCRETDSLSAVREIFSPQSDTLAFGVDMALMCGMPEHSRRTVTASDPRNKRWLEDPEPPIALRAWSASIGNQAHELDLGQTTYVCGAHPDCAIVIDDPQISSRHALFERRGGVDRAPTLRVRDTDSKNGIRLRGERLASFDVTAGQPFELGRSVTVLPMSEAMRVARRRLFNVYGGGTPELPLDQLLIEALGNGNLLVLGPPGGGHQELALAVHAVSPRRTVPPELPAEVPTDLAEQHALVERAARSTLFLSLPDKLRALRAAFVDDLMSVEHEIRVIAYAPTFAVARRVLGADVVGRMRHVLLRPLRTRLEELPQIFNQLLAARASTLRMEHLSAEHQAALRGYAWPNDVDELAEVASCVAAVAPSPTQIVSVREAAHALNLGRTALYDNLRKVGLAQFWESLDAAQSQRS
jgi:hypothetical protein